MLDNLLETLGGGDVEREFRLETLVKDGSGGTVETRMGGIGVGVMVAVGRTGGGRLDWGLGEGSGDDGGY